MDKELGNRIKQLRQQADLTQSQLARVLNVSPALISAFSPPCLASPLPQTRH